MKHLIPAATHQTHCIVRRHCRAADAQTRNVRRAELELPGPANASGEVWPGVRGRNDLLLVSVS